MPINIMSLIFRLAFTVDGAYGAFLTGPTEVILFAIKDLDDKIEIKPIHKTLTASKQVFSSSKS